MADGDGITDVVDASGNGQGVALNVTAPQPFINDTMLVTDPNAPYRVRSLVGLDTALASASSAGLKPIASRTLLAAETIGIDLIRYLHEVGREGPFKFFSAANFLAQYGISLVSAVTADTRQGLIVPPTTDATGTSGAWIRQFTGPLNLRWFGAIADNATNSSPAIDGAFRILEALAIVGSAAPTIYRGSFSLYIPKGKYFFASPWEPLATISIYGDGGLGWGAATQIRFAAGIDGIRAQAYNTSGTTTLDGVTHFSGDALVIHDIYFIGGFIATEGEFHGLRAKRAFHIYNCTFDSFEGDGIYGHVSFGAGAPTEGNVNASRITNCTFANCRSGVSFQNADANAIAMSACSYIGNRRWGREDRSFLGNHEFGAHFDTNSRNAWNSGAAGHPCAYTHRTGHWYFAIDGQEVGASVNAPSGTTADNAYWAYWLDAAASPATGVPDWFNGIAVRSGGPVIIAGLNNASTVLGSHIESNGVSQLDQNAFTNCTTGYWECVSGGLFFRTRSRRLYAGSAGLISAGNFCVNGDFTASSSQNFMGSSTGVATDSVVNFNNTNVASILKGFSLGTSWGEIWLSYTGIAGMLIRGSSKIRFDIGAAVGTEIANIQNDGLHVTGIGAFSGALSASKLSGTNTGDQTTITGNAGTATKLATARAIGITGGGITATGVNFDGSAAINLNASVDAGHITLARMANLAANSIIGNNTGAGAVPLALTGANVSAMLSAVVSGGAQGAMSGQDKARLDASFTRYHSLLDCSGWLTAADAAGTYGMGQGDKCAITGVGTQYPLNSIYIAAADYPAAGTLNPKLRIRVVIHCNDVAPGVTFTAALHPVTRPATSGGAGLCIYTIGAAVASSGIAIATPAADSSNVAVGAADIALPADGHYVIGITTSGGALAASSHVHISAILQMRYA